MIDTIKKEQCTGCKMCADICNQKAISYVTDKTGFWYPKVDTDKCNKCGLCVATCPALNQEKIQKNDNPVVYAAWSKDCTIRHESTSGGVFWEIAKLFIQSEGVVAGASYGEDWKSARHFIARNMDELEKLRGSKYFQSDTEGIYRAVGDEVKKGKEVLFCGTPCQNAALLSYLGHNYENLYLMDFICRNVNSPLAFEKYISELEDEFGAKVTDVHLKSKKTGWQSLASQVTFSNGMEFHRDKNSDWWIKGFLGHDLYTRPSCEKCNYRTLPRKAADITIGDFWGISGVRNYDMTEGVSVVLLNTRKGIALFEKAKDALYIRKRKIEDAIPGNPALLHDMKRGEKQEYFFQLLEKHPFSEAVQMCAGEKQDSRFGKIKAIKKICAEIWNIQKRKDVSTLQYIYYNYFCKNIVHVDSAKIIPYKNAVIELKENSKIYLRGKKNLEVGINKLKGSKAETYIRMERDSVWNVWNGCGIFYGVTVEVKENAVFDTKYFTANTGSVIIADKRITFGEDVMLGRNIMIYDSDFHQIQDKDGKNINLPGDVVIEDHVWLTNNITILKNVTIGQGSIIAGFTQVDQDIPADYLVAGKARGNCVKTPVVWSRDRVNKYEELIKESQVILYGYGVEGKKIASKYKENIMYIIDNRQKADGIMTFQEFVEKYPVLDETYIWIIASPNYYEELYHQVRKHYPQVKIVSAT